MHFKTKSYAQHVALAAYYDGIVENVDSLTEAIQGCYGELVTDYPSMFANVTAEPLAYVEALREYVTETRDKLPTESNIQNEIDTIATLIDSTIYKLKFLA
jgi:CRISPR/Cas system CMR-associated protein Cmr5 small subunit